MVVAANTLNRQLQASSTVGLARFRAIEEAERTPAPLNNERIEDRLNHLIEKFETTSSRFRATRSFIHFQNELFWKGVHLFTYDPDSGTIRIWDEEDQDMFSPINLTRWAVEMNAAEYTKSNPKLTPHLEIGEDRKANQALQEVEVWSDCTYYDFWTSKPDVEQNEAHKVQFRDVVFGRVWHDKNAGPLVKMPILGTQDVQMPGQFRCLDCGRAGDSNANSPDESTGAAAGGAAGTAVNPNMQSGGEMGDQPYCPDCGSLSVMQSPGMTQTQPVVQGYQELHTGAMRYKHYDALQVQLDDRCQTIDDATRMRVDEVCEKAEIEERYPWVKVGAYSPTVTRAGGFSGLHFMRQLETIIGNTGELDQSEGYQAGRGVNITDENTCIHSLEYLLPCHYRNISDNQPWQMPGTDQIIPPGTKLGDLFPAGLEITLVNGSIVFLRGVKLQDEWDCYKYSPGGSGFHGGGIADIISINKAYNEENSIQIAWALMASYGILLVDEKVKNIRNRPDTVSVVEDRMPNESLRDMAMHISTPGPTQEMEMMKNSHKGDMQLVAGARNPNSSGMPGEGMRTATGVNYQSATSDSFAAMRLLLRAWFRARMMGKAYNIWKKNATLPSFYTKQGETRGRWLEPINFPDQITFRVESDSHQPLTNDDMRANVMAAMQAGWGSGKLMPFAEEHIGKVFKMPTGPDNYNDWAVKAEVKLDAMKEIAQLMYQGGAMDEEVLPFLIQAGSPRPLDNPAMFARFFIELYLTDEFEKLPPALKVAVEQLFMLYSQMAMAQAMAAAGASGNGPNNKGKGDGGDNSKSDGKQEAA